MKILIFLKNKVPSFDFSEAQFSVFKKVIKHERFDFVSSEKQFLNKLPAATHVFVWVFKSKYYEYAQSLKQIWTPAAGKDWIAKHKIPIFHGCFHGQMIREGFLSFLFFFQGNIKSLLCNQNNKAWDRTFQRDRKLLSQQRILILGAGAIGQICGKAALNLGMEVVYLRRKPQGVDEISWAEVVLHDFDHILNLIPGAPENKDLLGDAFFKALKPGCYFYNFGRGNTVQEQALLTHLNSGKIAGAGLDVTQVEPLPKNSKIWSHPNIILSPHSSCIYEDYTRLFVEELLARKDLF
jgi:phosphoglycerate dehydrogenase-like enzyme